jgi:hypothetical protein
MLVRNALREKIDRMTNRLSCHIGGRRWTRRNHRTFRHFSPPYLEALEDRTVPSGGYVFHTIDDPQAAGTGTYTGDVNNRLQIVGNYYDANGVGHGFLFSNGQYVSLPDDPQAGAGSGQGTYPADINNLGQIVGVYFDTNNVGHGFVLVSGHFINFDEPNAGAGANSGTVPSGINDSGAIVGAYIDATNIEHGFLLSKGQYTTLDDPNAVPVAGEYTSAADGINASGQIVGFWRDSNGVDHGYLLSQGQYTSLPDDPLAGTGPSPGAFAQGTAPGAINAAGQISGTYVDSNYTYHGFVLSQGQYVSVDDPNAALGYNLGTIAGGINDAGQVAGFYHDATDVGHGFLATPIAAGSVASPVPMAANPASGTLPLAALGSLVTVSPPTAWWHLEANGPAPQMVSAAPSTGGHTTLLSFTSTSSQLNAAAKAGAKADTAVRALDQLFADSYGALDTRFFTVSGDLHAGCTECAD